MMITIRIIAALVSAAPLLAAPAPTRAGTPPSEPVAEAMFLCDALPPGGRDLTLAVAVAPGPEGGAAYVASPRLQVALALGERLGLTADVGLGTSGVVLDAPGASLKLLLRAPGPEATGLALSADFYGGSHDPRDSEAGLGLGVIRALGRVTLRAGASVATPVAAFGPHLHGGVSGAVAVGRFRLLGEVVTEAAGGEAAWAAGPSVKVALGEGAAISTGALFPFTGGPPTFTVQVAQGL